MSLSRRTRHLVHFLSKSIQCLPGSSMESASTEHLDAKTAWKAHFDGLCQVTTASGAEWTCNGDGGWHLLEANGVPLEAAVAEFLEQLGIPAGVSLTDSDQQVVEFSIAARLAEFYRMGFALPIEELRSSRYAKCSECCPGCYAYPTRQPADSEGSDGEKQGNGTGLISGFRHHGLQPLTHLFHDAPPDALSTLFRVESTTRRWP